MQLPLWIGFQSGPNLKCWYAHEEQEWVKLGEIVSVENILGPMLFCVHKDQLESMNQAIYLDGDIHEFRFFLNRDDLTLLPVYETGTPATKIMAVFGEFSDSLYSLVQALDMSFVSFESANQPGLFKLQVRFPACLKFGEFMRILGLLRAGIEILSFTRGFQLVDLELC
ncbi:MAG: hypothetical protein WCK49_05140 [Myxococcaceae bacterium]